MAADSRYAPRVRRIRRTGWILILSSTPIWIASPLLLELMHAAGTPLPAVLGLTGPLVMIVGWAFVGAGVTAERREIVHRTLAEDRAAELGDAGPAA